MLGPCWAVWTTLGCLHMLLHSILGKRLISKSMQLGKPYVGPQLSTKHGCSFFEWLSVLQSFAAGVLKFTCTCLEAKRFKATLHLLADITEGKVFL